MEQKLVPFDTLIERAASLPGAELSVEQIRRAHELTKTAALEFVAEDGPKCKDDPDLIIVTPLSVFTFAYSGEISVENKDKSTGNTIYENSIGVKISINRDLVVVANSKLETMTGLETESGLETTTDLDKAA